MRPLLLRRAGWRAWAWLWTRHPAPGWEWPWRLRCDGYRQIGYVDGERTHMAQYCYRMHGHRGLCLAPVDHRARDRRALFNPDREQE